MDMADIAHHEMVLISNLSNGERFETYVIPGERGSGKICLNGAAARKGLVGDRIIIITTRYITEDELKNYKPAIIVLSDNNKPVN
jgi:aspartate 1-decarboxylase